MLLWICGIGKTETGYASTLVCHMAGVLKINVLWVILVLLFPLLAACSLDLDPHLDSFWVVLVII